MDEFGQKFPRWLGPVIGAGVGVAVACRGMKRQGAFDWTLLIGGALIGTLGGSVLWLMDAPPTTQERQASVLGSLLAVLAIFPGVCPVVGLVFGISAFLMNRRVTGWQNTASRPGLGLCIVLTVIGVVASIVPLR
jgi:hypothetical protein